MNHPILIKYGQTQFLSGVVMKFSRKKRLFLSLIALVSLAGCEAPYGTAPSARYHSPYYYNTYAPSSNPVYSPVIYDPYPYYGYPHYYHGWGRRHHHWW